VGLQYRAIRAAATALLVALALGAGGMAGMTSALAADPAMVELSGTVVDGSAAPLAGIPLVITEELSADGGIAAFQVLTAADGSFRSEVYAWGTTEAPASVTIAAAPEVEVINGNCSQRWAIAIEPAVVLPLVGAAPEPLTVRATRTLLGEVCGTTGTPPRGNAGGGSSVGTPELTPPPTDRLPVGTLAGSDADRLGPALSLGFVGGMLIAGAFLLPRPGVRRRN
jgi:hypothetical protein